MILLKDRGFNSNPVPKCEKDGQDSKMARDRPNRHEYILVMDH